MARLGDRLEEQEVLVVINEVLDVGAHRAEEVVGALLYEGYLYRSSPTWPTRLIWELMDDPVAPK